MPFDGEKINPSLEAVMRLPDTVGEYELIKIGVPVVFGEGAQYVIDEAERLGVDAILSVGQAGGRGAVTPELVGINLRYAKIPDNKGNQPIDEPIIKGGDNAHFSTLPMRKIAEAIKESGIPSELSYSAGTYVCNDLIYTVLHHFSGSNVRFGFIHVPFSVEQGKEPSMPLDDIVRSLTVAIDNLD